MDADTRGVEFGALESVPLREGWAHEARHFTPWLAQNLNLLESALELRLELVGVEQQVGIFAADILCKSPDFDHFILVENQIERTDHSHLGQALTYAAGLDAVTIVWVAGKFADEHRACLDWLNRSTREGINFFGIEVELWRIGSSPYAPKLKVVSQPNSWTKQVATASESLADTATSRTQHRYWTQFANVLTRRAGPLKPTKPLADNWMTLSPFGLAGVGINAYTKKRPSTLGVCFYLTTAAAPKRYEIVLARREEIEETLGPLRWHISNEGWTAYCSMERHDLDPYDEDSWADQHEWLASSGEQIYEFFKTWIPGFRSEQISS